MDGLLQSGDAMSFRLGNYDKTIPCRKDCPDRSSCCHATCVRYIEWQRKHKKQLEQDLKENDVRFGLIEIARTRYQRLLKRRHKEGS